MEPSMHSVRVSDGHNADASRAHDPKKVIVSRFIHAYEKRFNCSPDDNIKALPGLYLWDDLDRSTKALEELLDDVGQDVTPDQIIDALSNV